MKKLFPLAAVLVAALFSCVKKEDIVNLQKQIDGLKSNEIASIQRQMSGIQISLSALQTTDDELLSYISILQQQESALEQADRTLDGSIASLRSELASDIDVAKADALSQLVAFKATVTDQLAALRSSIDSLSEKDIDLQGQITALQSYVNDLKTFIDNGDNSVKAWVTASFATLEQYNTTAGIVAGIQSDISAINTRIEELAESINGVTKTELEQALSALDSDHQTKLNKAVNDFNAAISSAKEEITTAYKAAISSAIAASESSMKSWVNDQLSGYYTIVQTDAKISELRMSLEGQLSSQKTYLEGLISNLETSLTSKINSNKTLIDGLQSQINGLGTDLATLSTRVSTNATNISVNAEEIAANAHTISANAADINVCEQLIAENKRLIQANESAISDNGAAISALQNRVTADEESISQNASTIAKNAEDIAVTAELIASNATAIVNNARAISDNAAAIVNLRSDLSSARTEITAGYQQAISTAINTLDGQLRDKIASDVATINSRIDDEIAAVNAVIDALTARVATCESDIRDIKDTISAMQQAIDDLQDQVAAILARIQSISFVPAYSDGKVPVNYTYNGTLTPGTACFDFKLQPASSATELAAVWQTALRMEAVYTITKAAPEVIQLTINSATADNGYLTVTVSGDALKEDFFRSRCSASATLIISDGNNELASEYIKLFPWTVDAIFFVDPVFKAYCVGKFDTNGDGEISKDEAKVVTAINASMLNITSLVGIEYFSNLESIDVSFNELETLDLSHSPKLESVFVNDNKLQTLNLDGLTDITELDCSNNKITTLNIREAERLLSLNCSNNQLGTLNINNNKSLAELQCSNNQLTALDIKSNTYLETLSCRKCGLSVLDLTRLSSLKNLDCSNNNLTSLNVYQNALLETLYCADNSLTSLGVRTNSALVVLDCSGNSLTALDLSLNTALKTLNCSNNALTSLDVSRNAALESVDCCGNIELAKLWVKDAAQQTALTIHKEDATQIAFNNDGIYIPDTNLKNYMLALFDDDEDGEISIIEAENVQYVNCSGRSISDLTGLQDCPNLKYLNFSTNNVSQVNLPNLGNLETIVAYDNPIERLNVNNDIAIKALYLQNVNTNALDGHVFTINAYDQAATLYLAFAGTGFTTLNLTNSAVLTAYDIAENIQLTRLVASGNSQVTEVNLSPLTSLTYLDVNACGLTSLNVDTNINLVAFDCSSNALTALNIDKNVALVTLDCSDNNLSTLRVTNNTSLDKIDCSDNNLVNINVRRNTILKTLNVSNNADITALDLGYNMILETLDLSNTGLTDINLSENLAIKSLNLSGCSGIHFVDFTANTALVSLNVSSTSLTTLDVSGNLSLAMLDVSGNTSLTTLDYKEGVTITSGFSVGQYIQVNGVKGVTFYVSGTTTKIVSIDETRDKWSTQTVSTQAKDYSDGMANTNKLDVLGLSDYPAAQWCREKGSSWYLPAENELSAIYKAKTVLNTTLSSISGTQLGTDYYWTSSEYNYSIAWYISFEDGSHGHQYGKSNSYHVRAVRAL